MKLNQNLFLTALTLAALTAGAWAQTETASNTVPVKNPAAAVPGTTISTPDITAPVTTVFGNYFSSTASSGYGSTFLYIQSFNLNNNDASSIQSVTVTLVNSQGDSMVATAQ